ncbi:MAG: nucleoside deaminase [bacterium]|nr:nucleoside deaminase [bacterium]
MNQDELYMKIALEEAKIALDEDNLPIGAALIIGDRLIDKSRNQNRTNKCWSDHAENSLIINNSKFIKKAIKEEGLEVSLYTTMEPCLMCLGTIALHRISNLIYACPDPISGAARINLNSIGAIYQSNFPNIKQGYFTKESYELFIDFLSRHQNCIEMLKRYKSFREDILKNSV